MKYLIFSIAILFSLVVIAVLSTVFGPMNSVDMDGLPCVEGRFYDHEHLGKVYNQGFYFKDSWYMKNVESGDVYIMPCYNFRRIDD